MSSFSRSMTLNLFESASFSEKAVSMWLRAAGPRSFQNHQLVSAWFSKSQMAMRIFPWAWSWSGTRIVASAIAVFSRNRMDILFSSSASPHGSLQKGVSVWK
jgi:hypothetical protein